MDEEGAVGAPLALSNPTSLAAQLQPQRMHVASEISAPDAFLRRLGGRPSGTRGRDGKGQLAAGCEGGDGPECSGGANAAAATSQLQALTTQIRESRQRLDSLRNPAGGPLELDEQALEEERATGVRFLSRYLALEPDCTVLRQFSKTSE
ncbi:hypothetical protein ACSSS7_006133 [Eimeria intestinalis]